MRLSLVFLTYNRLGIVARCFQSLAATLADSEIEWRILDNNSTDGTADWLMRFAALHDNVHVTLMSENTGVAGGRQILFEQARGDIIVSMDSDVEATRDGWLTRLIAPLNDPGVGVCGPGGNWLLPGWEWYEPAEPGYWGEIDTVSGYCQAFRRDVMEAGFMFDMFFSPYWHEDTYMCLWIRENMGKHAYCMGDPGLRHIYAGTGDDGRGREKQEYLASLFRDKRLVRFEREALSV